MKTKTSIIIVTLLIIFQTLPAKNFTDSDTLDIEKVDTILADTMVNAIDTAETDVQKITELDTMEMSVEKPTVIEKGDTTYVILGKKRIEIIEKEDGTTVNIENDEKDEEVEDEYEDDDEFEIEEEYQKPAWKEFKGHWVGFEFGLNNYVNNNFQLTHAEESKFMEVEPWKSWNFNLNFAQYSIGFGTDFVGAVVGLGLEWNNYHFANDSSITKENNEIIARGIPENTTKNRLQTTYLTAPLLFEIQTRNHDRSDRLHFSIGVIGGVRIFSNTKIKYEEDGDKHRLKNKNDYFLSPLRYGVISRIGYKNVDFYFNYYLTPLFQSGKGPELYPLAAGLVLSFS
ncbi:MAG: hypothetical protein JW894_07775 [Bacteroidales bacterium]|nr:hypothetical protein [Bacteroidales bacterium]